MNEYKTIKKYIRRFSEDGYFSSFSSAELFINIFDKKKYIFSFVNNFYYDSLGIQLFINNNGFNYVHDILTVNSDNMLVAGRIDSICAIFLKKELLTDDDIAFIHKMGSRVTKDDNLVIYRYELGYMKRYANKKEMEQVINNSEFILSLIGDNYNDVNKAFDEEKIPLSLIDRDKYEYITKYIPLPNLETMPKKLPVNEQVVQEFMTKNYLSDECYLFTAYTPLIIKETGVRPVLLYFLFPKSGRVIFKYITDKPKEYKNYIFGILDDVFTKEGIPEKMYINDRNIYSYLAKTLDYIHVEYELLLEENNVDFNLMSAVEKLYRNSEELYLESKDGIEMVLELIITELNAICDKIVDEDDEIEDDKIVV